MLLVRHASKREFTDDRDSSSSSPVPPGTRRSRRAESSSACRSMRGANKRRATIAADWLAVSQLPDFLSETTCTIFTRHGWISPKLLRSINSDPLWARILPRRADASVWILILLRELVVDTSEMRELLQGYFDELDWTGGTTKDALVAHLAGRDEALRTMVNQYVAEGTYQNLDEVMNVLPEQAWQSVQGDTWQGPESQYVEDVPSHFAEGPVGQAERDV